MKSATAIAYNGPLPETDSVDEATAAGRDNCETQDAGDDRDTDPIAGGGILGNIARAR